MGNSNCSKCIEDLEHRFESNLQEAAILQAYNNTLHETELNSLAATGEIDFSKLRPSHPDVSLIQKAWRRFQAKNRLKQLKGTCLSSVYFTTSDISYTVSKGLFKDSRKRRKITYPNGAFFEGEAKGGFRDGYGKMIWLDGCTYEGNWSFGYPSGYGKFLFSDKDSFEGKWGSPFPSSKRSFSSSTKSFDGSQNYTDGYCIQYVVWLWAKTEALSFTETHTEEVTQKTMECISEIYMELCQKIFNIKATVQEMKENLEGVDGIEYDKGFYIGSSIADRRNGVGKQTWGPDWYYIGEWKNDLNNGCGKKVWPDGAVYIGKHRDNYKEGVGEYLWCDKNLYVGEWSEDEMQGVGKYVYTDGREYLGEWRNGNMEGFGVFRWGNGRRYEGEWKEGKKHGRGITFEVDGSERLSMWEYGRIVEQL